MSFSFATTGIKRQVMLRLRLNSRITDLPKRQLHTRPPLDRMQQIFHAIKSGEFPNRHSLAADVEVTIETIQRDLDFIAGMIHELTGGKVKCIIYTRNKGAKLLDPKRFVINFTLDDASLFRRSWAPESARMVYSAWEGKIRDYVGVNFLEHHHLAHTASTGSGKICPATRPETTDKTCDGVKCDFCFRTPIRGENSYGISVRRSSQTVPESSIALGTATSTKMLK